MPKLPADTSACAAQTVVEPSCWPFDPGKYHPPPESDWLAAMTATALATAVRTFAMSVSGAVLQKSDRPYASDSASVANPWPWIQEWPCVTKTPSFWLDRRNASPRPSALAWSPANG